METKASPKPGMLAYPPNNDDSDGTRKQEFDDYLKCGLLEHGFLRVTCDA